MVALKDIYLAVWLVVWMGAYSVVLKDVVVAAC